LAQASDLITLPAFAIAANDITSGSFGRFYNVGILNIDTSAFSTGDRLYVSETIPGALTNVKPTYPNYAQRVGIVLVSGIGNGKLLVNISNNFEGDETGTTENTFSFGDGTAGTKILNYVNDFTGSLQWSPTDNRTLTLPDTTDTLATATQVNTKLTRSSGDLDETSFMALDNQTTPQDITGFTFNNASVRSFEAQVSIVRDTTYAIYNLQSIQKASSWEMTQSLTGDETGIIFSIDSSGQVQYTSSNTGNNATLRFRAITTSV
jgi:hypothetical protein